jgi:hypothetical protein
MLPIQSLRNSLEWMSYFGKRYLKVSYFIFFCKTVGLYG